MVSEFLLFLLSLLFVCSWCWLCHALFKEKDEWFALVILWTKFSVYRCTGRFCYTLSMMHQMLMTVRPKRFISLSKRDFRDFIKDLEYLSEPPFMH